MNRLSKNKRVFLGGTTNDSKWRDELIPLLNISYFNPVVKTWDEKAKQNEFNERKNDDFLLYTITPKMLGYYSIAELICDVIKKPNKTIFCLLKKDENKTFNDKQLNSFEMIAKMVKDNGGKVFYNLQDVANYLNKNK